MPEVKDIEVMTGKINQVVGHEHDEPKCYFPGCRHVGEIAYKLELSNEEYAFAQLTFCWYHYCIVIGNKFTCYKTPEYEFVVEGPLDMVQIAEQVIAAREMIAQKREDEKAASQSLNKE